MRKESALSRLAKNLSSPGHDYRINTELFGTIDTARISRELDLENQGRERGQQNQPASSSTAPDARSPPLASSIFIPAIAPPRSLMSVSPDS